MKAFGLIGISVTALIYAGCSSPGAGSGTAAPVSGAVKVLLIGKPDEDGIDPVTGKPLPGVKQLETAFETKFPNIDMQITNYRSN